MKNPAIKLRSIYSPLFGARGSNTLHNPGVVRVGGVSVAVPIGTYGGVVGGLIRLA